MKKAALLILNLEEIRRRSKLLWSGLPEEFYFWKPDPEAMTAIEIIRHVLGADYGWDVIITNNGDMTDFQSPWEGRPYISLADELEFAAPYRQAFLERINGFSDAALETTEIIHPGNGQKRKLEDYLLRIGYHESVHAGQFISYLRAIGVARPFIWD
ncbi:DinB family protein [Limibacter armeniacum]|uniref:DinB family protein n=1 Tax=Limibacter armeniacum TaxID=466084 RepID=UPI002FE64520